MSILTLIDPLMFIWIVYMFGNNSSQNCVLLRRSDYCLVADIDLRWIDQCP